MYRRMRRNLAGVLTIAVTGTKGKTSTSEFIAQLMEANGLTTAVSTTESARIGTRYIEACATGQDVDRLVTRCHRTGIDCFVMELTSSLLRWEMQRAFDIDAAVLTNIGTDHIWAHGNVRNYVAVKQRMFRDLRASADSPGPIAVLNADDAYARAFSDVVNSAVAVAAYGTSATRMARAYPRLRARDVTTTAKGVAFTIDGLSAGPHLCETSLRGSFNVENVLAAIACVVALGADPRETVRQCASLVAPAGRFVIVAAPSPNAPTVVVDYAHTPESLDRALMAGRDLCSQGRVHAVFGCGGDTYKRKRPMMGAVAARRADSITITTDNARSEDPGRIAADILRGVPREARHRARIELDRRRAIDDAIREAEPGDIVLLLGRGTERVQQINGRSLRFSDISAARTAVRRRASNTAKSIRLNADSAVLLDARGTTLLAHHADADRAPASLVKLMTLYLACDDVAAGRARLDDAVSISRYAALTPHPRMPRRPGVVVPLRPLMQAIAVRSANVAATAIAEHLGGSEASFVARMNDKACELGLTATRFATPHGLPHRHQRTTAADMARLARSLLQDHPLARAMLGRRTFRYQGRAYQRRISLFDDPGQVRAIKTGFTNEAGYNVMVAAGRGDRVLLAVVMGATSRALSFADARKLLHYGAAARARQR